MYIIVSVKEITDIELDGWEIGKLACLLDLTRYLAFANPLTVERGNL
jgi:hypothetical protein